MCEQEQLTISGFVIQQKCVLSVWDIFLLNG